MSDTSHEQQVNELVAAFLQAEAHGSAPTQADLLNRHPDLAQELESFLADHNRMKKLAAPVNTEFDADTLSRTSEQQQIAETLPPPDTPEGKIPDSFQIPGYEILGELGRGGMGVVYKAKHLGLNRMVALKMILAGVHAGEDDLRRFVSEAEAVAAFSHPNIVQVYDVGRHGNLPYMALEYIDGGSLADRLKGGPLPAKEAAQLVEQIARGMNVAHQAGIVHRDLKPANVLLGVRGEGLGVREEETPHSLIPNPSPLTPKVTDFGLAKKVEGGAQLTQTGAIMGTPAYMAPEQAGGEGKRIGPAADVYALGAILYECLTGRPPFRAENPLDTILQVVENDPPSLRAINKAVPRDLDTICLKCLQKTPQKRYPSAEALADDLQRFQSNEPITARRVGRFERFQKWVLRRPSVAFLTLFCIISCVMLLVSGSIFGLLLQQQMTEAVESAAEAKKARVETQKALAQVETTLAESLMRPLGRESGPLSAAEKDALQEIAALPSEGVRRRFLQVALQDPQTATRFTRRLDEALHAAVGLSSARRRETLDLLQKNLRKKDTPFTTKKAYMLAGVALSASDKDIAARLAVPLKQLIDESKIAADLISFLKAYRAIEKSLPDQPKIEIAVAAGSSIERVIANAPKPQIGRIDANRPMELTALAEEFNAMAPQLGKEGASKAAFSLAENLVINQGYPIAGAKALPLVAERLSDAGAAELARRIAECMVKEKKLSAQLFNGGFALTVLAKRLSAKEAAQVCDIFLEELSKPSPEDPSIFDASLQQLPLLGRHFAAVAACLDQEEADRVGKALNQKMSADMPKWFFWAAAFAYSGVIDRLDEETAAKLNADAVQKILTRISGAAQFENLLYAQVLDAIAPKLDSNSAARVVEYLRRNPKLAQDRIAGAMYSLALGKCIDRLKDKHANKLANELIDEIKMSIRPAAIENCIKQFAILFKKMGKDEADRQCAVAAKILAQKLAAFDAPQHQKHLHNALDNLIPLLQGEAVLPLAEHCLNESILIPDSETRFEKIAARLGSGEAFDLSQQVVKEIVAAGKPDSLAVIRRMGHLEQLKKQMVKQDRQRLARQLVRAYVPGIEKIERLDAGMMTLGLLLESAKDLSAEERRPVLAKCMKLIKKRIGSGAGKLGDLLFLQLFSETLEVFEEGQVRGVMAILLGRTISELSGNAKLSAKKVAQLATTIEKFGPRMTNQEKAALERALLKRIKKSDQASEVYAFAHSLNKLGVKLNGKESADVARALERHLPKELNGKGLRDTAELLQLLSPDLKNEIYRQLSSAIAKRIVRHAQSANNPRWTDITLAWRQLSANSNDDEGQRQSEDVARHLIRKLQEHRQSDKKNTADAAKLEQALAAFIRTASDQGLVELLKMPACLGESREILLREYGRRAGHSFATLWEFVAWAEANRRDLDLRSPLRLPLSTR